MGIGPFAFLTGDIGAGKTTICRQVVDLLRRRGRRVGGILTQPLYDATGRKTTLLAVDLWQGETRTLASLRRHLSDLRRGPYSFDPATFEWANRALLAALRQRPALIILDEVGPLELDAGVGFGPALPSLLAAPCPTLFVVRRACLCALEARLGFRPLVFQVDNATRNALPAEIAGTLCPICFPEVRGVT